MTSTVTGVPFAMLSFLSFFDELDDEPTQTRLEERRGGARAFRDRMGDRVGGFGGGRGGGRGGGGLRTGRARPSGPQLQRLAALAVAVLVVVVLGVLYLRSCQRDREVEAYRNFVNDANRVTQSSNQAGRQFQAAVVKQGQTSRGLLDALDEQIRTQDQAVRNAQALDGPDPMQALTPELVEAMQYRKNGLEGLRESLSDAFGNVRNGRLPLEQVFPVSGMYARLVASDVVYNDSFREPATEVLAEKDITNVKFDDSAFVSRDLLVFASPVGMQGRLVRIAGGNRPAGGQAGGNNAADGKRHGTSIESVTFNPGGQALEGQKEPISLELGTAGSESAFVVVVENGGETQETNIEVSVFIDREKVASKTIVAIEPGVQETVELPVAPDPGEHPLVRINVATVENETNAQNNTRTYRNVVFQVPST